MKVDKYRIGDLVMFSTKNLKYQMVRRTEKLTKRFMGPYRVKKIVLSFETPMISCEKFSGQGTLRKG